YGTRFSIAMLDIDHFKQVNDRQGHLFGDKVLQELARLLDECVRETDVVARYGGEEFIIVMPQTELFGACVFAERFRCRVAQGMDLTVSVGATVAMEGDTQQSLLARADAALYAAKAAGRNCAWRHDGDKTESIVEEVALASGCDGRM
ncbi:MAG: GGDEF domain-containing protein, partial [Patescibacteria group bacterium]|nr:GGDEF domain-containing protein [Patescibacteria group bacterium]